MDRFRSIELFKGWYYALLEHSDLIQATADESISTSHYDTLFSRSVVWTLSIPEASENMTVPLHAILSLRLRNRFANKLVELTS